jgi:hypothetical protein
MDASSCSLRPEACSLAVLVIGKLEDAALVDGDFLHISRATTVRDALAMLKAGAITPPDLVVLAETRGGLVGPRAVDELRRALPLVRYWRVRGSWREGVARGIERPPAGCLSSDAQAWPARFARELEILGRGANPIWSLPPTATAEEQVLAVAERGFRATRRGTLAICAASASAAAALADLCHAAGYATRMESSYRLQASGSRSLAPDVEPPACLLWDATVGEIRDPARAGTVRAMGHGAPVVAIVGFPRPEDVELARHNGISAVLAKPLAADDLFWQIERAAG